MLSFIKSISFILLFTFLTCFQNNAYSEDTAALANHTISVNAEVIIDNLPKSWSVNIAEDSSIYIVHREGGITRLDSKNQSVNLIDILPSDLFTDGQGGLLDLAFHPEFAKNQWIYLSYSAGAADNNYLKIIRFKLNEALEVIETEQIFRLNESSDTPVHYGGRLLFLSDNTLFVTTGDGFDYRERAQVLTSQKGKVLRMSELGEPLKTNPFYKGKEAAESWVYSLGHRNPQSIIATDSQVLVAHEHGPDGGDEVNLIRPGQNYGWPVVTNGKDYIGSSISPFKTYPGMQLPEFDWSPSIAPSGMVYIESQNDIAREFTQLSHRLLITSLKYQQVRTLLFENNTVTDERLLFQSTSRLRDIALLNGKTILLLTDGEEASLLRLNLE